MYGINLRKAIDYFSLSFLVIATKILIITSISFNILENFIVGTKLFSSINSIQYLVSEASFKAIKYFDKKSFYDWA